MAEQTILIVEDDPDIRDGVRILLAGEGYHILEAENGLRALELFDPEVDLVILDIMMPGMSGLRVCEELRKTSAVPILFLTAKSQESDKLLGLTAGGDDYLAKPFSFAELSARVKALLRRYCVYQGKDQVHHKPHNTTLELHGVRLALDCNRVWVDEREVDLTETEYKILRLLMQNCWVSVKQFSKNDTATACQDWLRSTRLGRGSIKSHVRTVKVLGMGLFAFQERVHLWKGVTH